MVVYTPGFSGGTVTLPPSKSAAHRALLCAALSRGRCTVRPIIESDDMKATLGAMESLGVLVQYDPTQQTVRLDASGLGRPGGGEIDCLESGSTLRFLIPIAAVLGGDYRFVGRGRLPQRPLGVYRDLLPLHGVAVRSQGGLPLEISGRLLPGAFRLPGDVSSQFITGLLLALPLLEADSTLQLTSPLESAGYVDLTRRVLEEFGVTTLSVPGGWTVPGQQAFSAGSYTVEGDWSQAAFFLCMAALDPAGHPVHMVGLRPDSTQGDRACADLFGAFGVSITWENGVLTAQNTRAQEPHGGLTGQVIDVSQIPDLAPALAVCGAFARGETRLINAARLRLKESDRLAAMEQAILTLGGQARATEDALLLTGQTTFPGGRALGMQDHRVVMALAALALRASGPVEVTDAYSIRKSYLGFFEDFRRLGGNAHVIHVG